MEAVKPWKTIQHARAATQPRPRGNSRYHAIQAVRHLGLSTHCARTAEVAHRYIAQLRPHRLVYVSCWSIRARLRTRAVRPDSTRRAREEAVLASADEASFPVRECRPQYRSSGLARITSS